MSETNQHAEHAHEHHSGAGIYAKTLAALLFLTLVTIGVSYIDFGAGNVVIALFIASIKAILVALFFMHLRYEKAVNGIIASAGFLFLGIFLMFCTIDLGQRRDPNPLLLNPPALAPAAAAPAAPAAEKK